MTTPRSVEQEDLKRTTRRSPQVQVGPDLHRLQARSWSAPQVESCPDLHRLQSRYGGSLVLMCKRKKEDSSSWRSNPATFHEQKASTLSVVPMAPWGFRISMVKLWWQVDNLNGQVMRSCFLWGSMRLFQLFQIQKRTRRSLWGSCVILPSVSSCLRLSSQQFPLHCKHNKIISWKDELLNLWPWQGLVSGKWTFWWYWGKYTTRTPPTNEALANLRK